MSSYPCLISRLFIQSSDPAWLDGSNLTRFDVPGLYPYIWTNNTENAGILRSDYEVTASCVLGGGTRPMEVCGGRSVTSTFYVHLPSHWGITFPPYFPQTLIVAKNCSWYQFPTTYAQRLGPCFPTGMALPRHGTIQCQGVQQRAFSELWGLVASELANQGR